ncbi:hypothetical protein E2C01_088167 [Portunus trituberculatus]|uniref:Uncharacterized protein n=1 Tax=Portunus trituberculatus TaxID=210409 RepID=A0A5B7J5E5_PORTR|nr:hypothetical protein [Portunus trituberculatus]
MMVLMLVGETVVRVKAMAEREGMLSKWPVYSIGGGDSGGAGSTSRLIPAHAYFSAFLRVVACNGSGQSSSSSSFSSSSSSASSSCYPAGIARLRS